MSFIPKLAVATGLTVVGLHCVTRYCLSRLSVASIQKKDFDFVSKTLFRLKHKAHKQGVDEAVFNELFDVIKNQLSILGLSAEKKKMIMDLLKCAFEYGVVNSLLKTGDVNQSNFKWSLDLIRDDLVK